MVQCIVKGLLNGEVVAITPMAAHHLVQLNIVKPMKRFGYFKLIKKGDERLWKELRKKV